MFVQAYLNNWSHLFYIYWSCQIAFDYTSCLFFHLSWNGKQYYGGKSENRKRFFGLVLSVWTEKDGKRVSIDTNASEFIGNRNAGGIPNVSSIGANEIANLLLHSTLAHITATVQQPAYSTILPGSVLWWPFGGCEAWNRRDNTCFNKKKNIYLHIVIV